ncbi:MAG: peptidylprolyl isomerase [Candidatus Magasanikbacteria bacterium]|nr:peptidylprolyl isomerase [Candidatus Magasanikbacteria bacterium]
MIYTAILHTSKGDIMIKLRDDQTPKTVQNFVDLAQKEFYHDTVFHRVIENFMIQGGCPQGNGMGGPGYKFDDEPFDGEYTRGTVAMANSGPHTNGSQFFIMHTDNPLPKNYVIFGHVEEGMDVVDAIATSEVEMSFGGELSKPTEDIKLHSVEIIEE